MIKEYKNTVVTAEFIEHRDELASNLKGENTTFRADFEWPEWYLGKVIPKESLHERFYGYSYDTTHPELGKCEFKYLAKTGLVHIGLYTQRQQFDSYIFWNWEKQLHCPNKTKSLSLLSEGDIIDFELIDVVNRDFVNRNIDYDKFNYYKYVQPFQSFDIQDESDELEATKRIQSESERWQEELEPIWATDIPEPGSIKEKILKGPKK